MKRFTSLLLLAAVLAGGGARAQLPDAGEAGRALWAEPVKQDANLYRIDDQLFRSEQPVADDAATLQQLGVKSVVNLRFFNRSDNRKILADRGIALHNRPLMSWRITPQEIAETLFLIEQQQKHGPVLVHCYHGADRTGLIAGMYRIVYQGWSIEQAKAEMLQGPYGFHSIWKNIENLFTADTVAQVRAHLETLRRR
ncbi:MAG: tyrosine-protein phosphatase [Eikenella sp.]|nr:tyrosine-protein phosphatase [Eikenella sp.]